MKMICLSEVLLKKWGFHPPSFKIFDLVNKKISKLATSLVSRMPADTKWCLKKMKIDLSWKIGNLITSINYILFMFEQTNLEQPLWLPKIQRNKLFTRTTSQHFHCL